MMKFGLPDTSSRHVLSPLVNLFSFSVEYSNVLFCSAMQRIAEIAGVVVSFDPKPIPVCVPAANLPFSFKLEVLNLFVSSFQNAVYFSIYLFFIFVSRVIGMELELTLTTGNAQNQNLTNNLII